MIRLKLLLASVLLAMTVGSAQAEKNFGPLTDVLASAPERDKSWLIKKSDAVFEMLNTESASAINYVYIDAGAQAGSKRRIATTVSVATAQDGSGFGGLLYAFDPGDRTYFMFVILRGGKVALFRRDKTGFREMMSVTTSAVKLEDNILAIEETGATIKMSVNGKEIGEIGNPFIGKGGVGLVVGGKVRATFTRFSLQRP